MALTEESYPQLPLVIVYEDKSRSQEDLRGSPFSQASTAPCTPIRFFLPDPFDAPPPPPLPLSIRNSSCWAKYKQAKEKPDLVRALPTPKKRKISVSKPLLSLCMSPWWAQYKQGWKESIPPVLRIAEPPLKLKLKSELAIWAQQKVEMAKVQPKPRQYAPRSQQEFAVLQFVYKSELEWLVKINVKQYLPRSQQEFAVLEFVTKEEYKVEHVDLVDDADWDILGAGQDEDGDDDDEWLQVDELYTPSVHEGMCVLTASPKSAGNPRCAISPGGRVLEFNGGGPVAFSCEAEHSSGHTRKVAAKNMAKASSEARRAKAASDVDAETLCSIDTSGIVRGGGEIAMDATAAQTRTDRLKLFHRKRNQRRVATISSRATRHLQVISADASGRIFLFSVKRARRVTRVKAAKPPTSVTTFDFMGVVFRVMEHSDVP